MDKKDTGDNLSTQKVLSASHDPGWNDPPKWVLSGAQSSSTTPTKRVLNKRVAFPLASMQVTEKDSKSQVNCKSINMPPPLQSPSNLTTVVQPPPMAPPKKEADGTTEEEVTVDKYQALNDSIANLQAVIEKEMENETKVEEIKKRLEILKSAWQEDKLNDTIHKKILDMSKALKEGNIEQADQIHISLLMQHASLCSPWISGIRHIILELKSKCQDSNSTEQKQSHLQLLPTEVEKSTNQP